MIEKIQVPAHSCIRIQSQIIAYFDPFMLTSAPHDADVVFLTHSHYDHLSPEDLAKVMNEDTLLVAPESILDDLAEAGISQAITVAVAPGSELEVLGVPVKVVPAYNTNKPFHPFENQWVGYVVTFEGQRIYVAGDTDVTPENQAVRCDIACVPVGGTYTTTAEEAACLVNEIRPAYAIPTHFGAVTGEKEDGARFASLVNEGIEVVQKLRY